MVKIQVMKVKGRSAQILYMCCMWTAVLLSGSPLSAAHIIGGELTYESLGFTNNNPASNSRRYRFTMTIYRDCQSNGANFDGAPNGSFPCHVTIYRGATLFTTLTLSAPTRTNLPANPGNPCVAVPPNVCVQEGIYVFPVLDLPISNESYHVVYQRCCRNNTITNILLPGSSGATYTIELTPQAQQLGNSSPRFTAYPPIVLCAGENFSFDFSAVDADGDQVVYEFCSPYLGGGLNFDDPQNTFNGLAPNPEPAPPYATVAFNAPAFSPTMPLGAASNLQLNAFTGRMTGVPSLVGQYVVGVCVSEYRNGVLLSTVRRDFQFNVTVCTNLVSADIREDSISADQQHIVTACGSTIVNLENQSGALAFIDGYKWEIAISADSLLLATSRNLTVDFPGPGIYFGRMVINPNSSVCSDTVALKIQVFPGIEADFAYVYDSCKVQPVAFTSLAASGGGPVVRHNWLFGDGGSSTLPNPSWQYGDPAERNVRLIAQDINGCKDTVIRSVRYFPVPPTIVVSPSSYLGCPPAVITFTNLSEPINTTYAIRWDFGDGGSSTAISPVHTFEEEGIFDIALEITSPLGCVTDTVFRQLIKIDPVPVAGFTYGPERLTNFNSQAQFTDASTGAYRWYWDFNGQGFSLAQNPSFVFPDTGIAYVKQVVTHPSGCIDSLVRQLDIAPETRLHFPNAFTPNDDSVNDVFVPKGYLKGYKRYTLRIWNRWGEVVFEADEPEAAWNGRHQNAGQPVPSGVYLYEMTLIGPRGEVDQRRGSLTLLR